MDRENCTYLAGGPRMGWASPTQTPPATAPAAPTTTAKHTISVMMASNPTQSKYFKYHKYHQVSCLLLQVKNCQQGLQGGPPLSALQARPYRLKTEDL